MKLKSALVLLLLCACDKPAAPRPPPTVRVNPKPKVEDPCGSVSQYGGQRQLVCKVEVTDDAIAEVMSARADRERATLLFTSNDPTQLASVNKVPWARSVLIYPDSKDAVTDLRELAALTQLQKLYVKGLVREVEDAWQFSELVDLHAVEKGEIDLSGAAALRNVTSLSVGGTVRDLSPLAQLTSLETLMLPGGLTDLSPLTSLPRLSSLTLGVAPKTSLAPLTKLAALDELVIGGTTTTTLVPAIEPLPKLTRLFLVGDKGPVDTRPLAKLTRLELLNFGELPVEDLAPLKSLPALKNLSVWNGQVKDLKVVLEFPALQHVLLPKDAPLAVSEELRRARPDLF